MTGGELATIELKLAVDEPSSSSGLAATAVWHPVQFPVWLVPAFVGFCVQMPTTLSLTYDTSGRIAAVDAESAPAPTTFCACTWKDQLREQFEVEVVAV